MVSGNKGEWSELFVLAKLLVDGRLYIADENLTSETGFFHVINDITTSEESDKKMEYKIADAEEIIIYDPKSGSEESVKRKVIREKMAGFLKEITTGANGRGAFPLHTGSEIQSLLKTKSLSASSNHKTDLIIKSYDSRIKSVTQAGYSIKSKLGSASTLFNASQATNLIYRVAGLNVEKLMEANSEKSCRKRVLKVYELGGKLIFLKIENNVFNSNLMRVDTNFDKMLAEALVVFYTTKNRSVIDVVNSIIKLKINDLELKNMESLVMHNFIRFLFYSSLGMVAKKPWNGLAIATGGVIIVKKNGEIIGYTPYDINLFQRYLLLNTKLDSPDSDRNKYGKIYRDGEENRIKLNFQIRFKA